MAGIISLAIMQQRGPRYVRVRFGLHLYVLWKTSVYCWLFSLSLRHTFYCLLSFLSQSYIFLKLFEFIYQFIFLLSTWKCSIMCFRFHELYLCFFRYIAALHMRETNLARSCRDFSWPMSLRFPPMNFD